MATYDWNNPGTFAAIITGNGTSGDLKNLADTYTALGAEVDNEGGAQEAGIQLKVRCSAAPSGSPVCEVWLIQALDGSNYEDGSAGSPGIVPARPPDLIIPVRLVNTQQVISFGPVPIPNAKFKALLRNSTGQALTNTDNENILSWRPWKTESN